MSTNVTQFSNEPGLVFSGHLKTACRALSKYINENKERAIIVFRGGPIHPEDNSPEGIQDLIENNVFEWEGSVVVYNPIESPEI